MPVGTRQSRKETVYYPVWRCSTVRLETGYVQPDKWSSSTGSSVHMAVLQWVIHSTSLVVTVTMINAFITVFTH